MEREELRIEISATAKQAISEIASTSTSLQNLATTGKASVDTVNEALRRLRETRNATFDSSKIKEFNQAIRETEFHAKGLKDIGIRSDVGEQARRARVAIYGLNQVVRDLPFGFIAISNNIPVLLDQFQALVRENKGVTGALKEFAKGLVGGAGISLAISAVLSLITSAVAQYGSLSNAVKALTGNLSGAAVAQMEFNKAIKEGYGNVQVQLANLTILGRVAEDSSLGATAQAAAYKELDAQLKAILPSLGAATGKQKEMLAAQLEIAKNTLLTRLRMEAFDKSIKKLGDAYAEAKDEGIKWSDRTKFAFSSLKNFLQFYRLDEEIVKVGEGKIASERIRKMWDDIQKVWIDKEKEVKDNIRSGMSLEQMFEGHGPKDKPAKEAKEVFDEMLKAQISYQKAAIESASEYGVQKIQLQRTLARLEATLRKNEATRNIQDQKALAKEIAAIYLELQTKLKELKKIPIAELEMSDYAIRRGLEKINRKIEKEKEKFDWTELGIDPDKMKKIEVSKCVEELETKWANMTVANAMAYEEMVARIAEQTALLSDIFDTLTSGVLEDFVTKGKAGFETLIENVGKLAIKLAEAAIKALIIQKVTQALQMAGGGGGGWFEKAAKFIGGMGQQTKIAGPAVVGMAAMTPQITTRISGNDLLVVLNRSMRTQGRIG